MRELTVSELDAVGGGHGRQFTVGGNFAATITQTITQAESITQSATNTTNSSATNVASMVQSNSISV
jgi:hypothetical protein